MVKFCILAIGPWYPATAFTFFVEAFARIGCRVIRVGPAYFEHYDLQWPQEDLPHIDRRIPRELKKWHLPNIVDWCTKYESAPDLLFLSEENYQTDIIPETRLPSVLWSADGWPENYARAALWQPTLAFCNQPRGNSIHPQEETPKPWRFLPGAAAPWIHKRLNFERNVDFCLLATMYGKRPELCQQLIEHGFNVVFGQRVLHDYVTSYNLSLATYHNPGWYEIKWRFFEAAAMGCVNISEGTPLFEELGYIAGQHYVLIEDEDMDAEHWPSVDALAETITDLRSLPELARQIAHNAWEHTLRNHNYFSRVRTILNALGMAHMIPAVDREIDKVLEENGLS